MFDIDYAESGEIRCSGRLDAAQSARALQTPSGQPPGVRVTSLAQPSLRIQMCNRWSAM